MKWNAFVYARGIQRTDGYKLRVQPREFPPALIQGCQTFFNMRSVNEKRCTWKEIFENDPDAWKKSFMFIVSPKLKSCILMRATKVETPDGNDILLDFEKREVWSLEGIWCPYEQLEIFFASLPSVLMWFANNKKSLCAYLKDKNDTFIETGNEYYYNPYDDNMKLPPVAEAFGTDAEKTAFRNLIQKIKFSAEPFSFVFGPLTDMIMKNCSGLYNIKEAFSTVDPSSLDSAGEDYFSRIEKAELVETKTPNETITYILQSCTEPAGKKQSVFRWRISEAVSRTGRKEFISGEPVYFSEEKGLNFSDLKAEAEAIRFFAGNIGWNVESQSDDNDKMYKFFKEK
ncbi:MAG: hypothetical protein K2G36_01895 [Ruminococcus sp.]|nr:hypothetical protein [Ruminococcus sp.]